MILARHHPHLGMVSLCPGDRLLQLEVLLTVQLSRPLEPVVDLC